MVEDLEREHRNEQQPSCTMIQQTSSNTAYNIPSSSNSTKFMAPSSRIDNQSSSDLIQSSQFNYLEQPSTIQSSLPTRTLSQSFDQNLASLQSNIPVQPNYQQEKTEERPIFSWHTNFLSLADTVTSTNSSIRPLILSSVSNKGDNSATYDHTRFLSPTQGKSGTQNLLTPADMELVPSSDISVVS